MAAPTRLCHVWVGAETGALKGVNLQRKEATNHVGGSGLSRGRGVSALTWGDPAQTELLVGSLDRSVSVFSTEKGKFTGERLCPGGDGAFCGLGVLGSSIVTAVESGLVRVWGEHEAEEPLQELQAGPGLCRMRQDPTRPHLVGTGGKENGLKVWDLQRPQEPLFRAKNVRNDWLDLRVPVWERDLQFLPGSQRVVTCTGHGQVRLYDPSTPQRRPVLDAAVGEAPLTALALIPGDTSVVVGSARGDVAVIDLRKGRVLRALKGFAGGVRGLQCHPRLPLVASVGLDRFLRVHQLRDGRLRDKVYLKSRLTCVLLSTHLDWEAQEEPPPQKEVKDEEGDELWDALESVPTPRKAKKRKISGV
ncbi:WD repeat-containing protein 74 isoform X1 [Catharus ustulatus]|uniref:WD repeat-containing protein 74 isoform X1 n=1 Tax=Catharus ustulatus TaxID=91951 RepID=UPI00140B558A|nr:WD repeat-containing protein 74 isoform X1 [Catharus ustulatus]